MTRPDLKVSIGAMIMRNPVMTASGTFGYGEEYAPYVDLNRLGAMVVKGLSLQPRLGNPPPRIIETPSGMLNAIGLQNVGVRSFVMDKLPWLRRFDVPVVANIYGESVEEYRQVSAILSDAPGVSALEINVSCPNVQKGGDIFGTDPDMAAEVTRSVVAVTALPVIVKLTPNVTDIALIAQAVEDAGAQAVSLINTLLGMSIDVESRRPHLANVTGGLSGPAIRPIAVRMVRQVVKKVNIPVIGVGGIMTAADALEFLIAGATAVQVGTANFIDPQATMHIIDGIEDYLRRHGEARVQDIIGTLRE
ncbi:MAG: dihydroorotate dehydrogenase [Syntrophales bacterium]|nr:dihydroorotate dehydrogenase [Syntrophales bacterium]